jgi:CheY-like chemotaxis protein
LRISGFEHQNKNEQTTINNSNSLLKSSKSPSSSIHASDQICFINYTQRYSVGFVDIINSTDRTSKIKDSKKLRNYYSFFINAMGSVIDTFNGKIVKNGGDNLFFYFPKTCDINNQSAFHDAFECSSSMVSSNETLNCKMVAEGLPLIDYRISMDYGEVEIAISPKSNDVDLFGSVVNQCAKMNGAISHTGIVIGKKLHEIANRCYFAKSYIMDRLIIKSDGQSKNSDTMFSLMDNDKTQNTNGITLERNNNQIQQKQDSNLFSSCNINIMLIDDDEDILYTFENILKRNQYRVKSFFKSIDALNHFCENNPQLYDLIVMDIRMPDMNGIQLYYRLKAINPNVRILLISALDIVQELIDALPDIQIKDIVKKPVSYEDFLFKVQSMVKS